MAELTAVSRETIYEAFASAWGTANPSIPFTFDNEPYKPSVDQWVRLSMRHQNANQETLGRIGERKFRCTGILIVQCFAKKGTGMADLDGLADSAKGILAGKRFAGVVCGAAIPREVPPFDAWQAVNVEVPFQYFETR